MTSMILTILSDLWELPRIALISGQCKVHHPRIRRLLELDFAWIFSTLEFPLLSLDGVTGATSIQLQDKFENLGAR